MAALEHRKSNDLEQTQKMILLITGAAFLQQVCELVFGVNVLGSDLRVQIDSVTQPATL